MCKVFYSEQQYKTIAPMRKLNFDDKDLFVEYLRLRLNKLVDTYQTETVLEICFSYIVFPGHASGHQKLLQEAEYTCESYGYNNYILPVTMNPSDYGNVVAIAKQNIHNDQTVNTYTIMNNKDFFIIHSSLDGTVNNVITDGGELQWTDTLISESIFKREINGSELYFKDGKCIVKTKNLKAKPIN